MPLHQAICTQPNPDAGLVWLICNRHIAPLPADQATGRLPLSHEGLARRPEPACGPSMVGAAPWKTEIAGSLLVKTAVRSLSGAIRLSRSRAAEGPAEGGAYRGVGRGRAGRRPVVAHHRDRGAGVGGEPLPDAAFDAAVGEGGQRGEHGRGQQYGQGGGGQYHRRVSAAADDRG